MPFADVVACFESQLVVRCSILGEADDTSADGDVVGAGKPWDVGDVSHLGASSTEARRQVHITVCGKA
ncbi:hypothetical protein D3C80_1412870 [compost metagenome]